MFDYCSVSTSDIAASPWREWLRTFKDHERGVHYLLDPGSQDITTQVMLDQLLDKFETVNTTPQDFWLARWGIGDLVSEGVRYWEENKRSPHLAAIKMQSRQKEFQALMAMSISGSFQVIEISLFQV